MIDVEYRHGRVHDFLKPDRHRLNHPTRPKAMGGAGPCPDLEPSVNRKQTNTVSNAAAVAPKRGPSIIMVTGSFWLFVGTGLNVFMI